MSRLAGAALLHSIQLSNGYGYVIAPDRAVKMPRKDFLFWKYHHEIPSRMVSPQGILI